MKLRIDSDLHNIDLTDWFAEYALDSQVPYGKVKTGEHYQLLAYLSVQLPAGSKVAELGTLYGNAAISLAYSAFVNVTTCDPSDHIAPGTGFKKLQNITYVKTTGQELLPSVIDSKIIFLDVDPHDGYQEQVIYDKLIALGFKGLLVCDDIHFQIAMPGNMGMQNFWDRISRKKVDVSQFGHWSGTGVVVFDPNTIDI